MGRVAEGLTVNREVELWIMNSIWQRSYECEKVDSKFMLAEVQLSVRLIVLININFLKYAMNWIELRILREKTWWTVNGIHEKYNDVVSLTLIKSIEQYDYILFSY
jgi:hypothetical protein